MSIVRVGLTSAEFATGYDAIFGQKKKAATKSSAKRASKKTPRRKKRVR